MRPLIRGCALALLMLTASAANSADPFYLDLLDTGTSDYLAGDFSSASKKLRIACFGFLDEPGTLAEGLVRLALAQAGASDRAGFGQTFDRLVEVETRFGSYSSLTAGSSLRTELERILAYWVEESDLARAPVFTRLLQQARDTEFQALPPERRRKELERRLRDDPDDSEALLGITRLDIAQGRTERAEKRLERTLAQNPENRTAHCARAQMDLRELSCDTALAGLAYCESSPADEILGPPYLECLIRAEDWDGAREFVTALPLAVRQSPDVALLALEIPPEESSRTLPEDVQAAPKQPEPARQPTIELPPEFRESIAEIRHGLDVADQSTQLDELFQMAEGLANAFPYSPEVQFLAAETAYRRADWADAVRYFRRGGTPGMDQPLLLFYMAVALFENGNPEPAADAFSRALPSLKPTPFVRSYAEKILGDGGSSGDPL